MVWTWHQNHNLQSNWIRSHEVNLFMSVTSVSDMIFLAATPFCRLKKVPQPNKIPSGDVPPIFVVIFSINSTEQDAFFCQQRFSHFGCLFSTRKLVPFKETCIYFFCSVSFTHRKMCHFSRARVDQLPFCWLFTPVALKTWTLLGRIENAELTGHIDVLYSHHSQHYECYTSFYYFFLIST